MGTGVGATVVGTGVGAAVVGTGVGTAVAATVGWGVSTTRTGAEEDALSPPSFSGVGAGVESVLNGAGVDTAGTGAGVSGLVLKKMENILVVGVGAGEAWRPVMSFAVVPSLPSVPVSRLRRAVMKSWRRLVVSPSVTTGPWRPFWSLFVESALFAWLISASVRVLESR